MSHSKFIDPSVTAAICSKSKSSTQTLHQRLSSLYEEDEYTYKDQDDDAFDSECEEQSHCNELPRRIGKNKEYWEIITTATFDEAKKYKAENYPNYNTRYEKPSGEGKKIYYHCARNKRCPKVIYILMHCDLMDCTIFECI